MIEKLFEYKSILLLNLFIECIPIHQGQTNSYYFPSLFGLIEDKLHLLPLWTGILSKSGISVLEKKNIISEFSKIKNMTRLSNNCVENRFKDIKNLIKKNTLYDRPCLPSEIVPKLYLLIKVKFLLNTRSQSGMKLASPIS